MDGQLIEGRRRDVRVVDDRTRLDEALGDTGDVIDANLGRRAVYTIRASEPEVFRLRERYVLERSRPGDVYRVVARTAAVP